MTGIGIGIGINFPIGGGVTEDSEMIQATSSLVASGGLGGVSRLSAIASLTSSGALGGSTTPSAVVSVTYNGRLWQPSDSSEVKTWWRGDLGITLNSTTVSNWQDQIQGKNIGASASIQPTYNSSDANFGNQASLSFGGTKWMQLSAGSLVENQPRGYFFVIRMTNVTSGSLIDGANGTNRNNVLFAAGPHLEMYAGNSVPQSSVTPLINTTYCAFALFDGRTNSYWRQNGSQSTAVDLGATGTQGITGINLFNAGPGGGIGAGAIAELGTFTADPSATFIALFENYCKARYGLSF